MAHRSSCKSRRVSFFFLDQMKLNFHVYMMTTRMMTLMSKMMLMTMTMMTVGHRYEYTRSNDRMWRKNTVGFVTMTTILSFFSQLLLFQIKHKLQHEFLFEISISGGKPWFNLYWSRFESKLS